MKMFLSICTGFLLVFGSSFMLKDHSAPLKVSALKMKGTFVTAYRTVKVEGFVLNSQGILRPASGYEIVYEAERGRFLIRPAGGGSATTQAGKGGKKLPAGSSLECVGCRDCEVKVLASGPGGTNYGCGGDCPANKGCFAMVMVPEEEVDQYMVGNEWRN